MKERKGWPGHGGLGLPIKTFGLDIVRVSRNGTFVLKGKAKM